EEQIFTQIHYIPVHQQPYYKKLGWNDGDMPKAEQFYLECISLPMYPALSNEEQDFVINSILQFYNNKD
ncbi:MAG: DegT/DnrJ/EryC1/StrS family aminotransferase, partial [Bacteroidetes bacterium]|nr:DegT/DnrJ/EryC1/StrS family aminotransferase [Bacteroidota bacterium]